MSEQNSYYEILKRMDNTYYELSGVRPTDSSETQRRLKVLAGEIHGIYCELKKLRKDMFISSASGEALDKHASQRGLTRHRGLKAVGTILVRVDSPLEYDLVIPEGTVFSTADGELEYLSTEQSVIYQGTGSCFVSLEARNSGSRYNVPPSSVTTVVTFFSSGLNITNSSAFFGGSDDEGDEAIRNRIIEGCRNISNGLNPAFYLKLAESVDGIYSASLVENAGNNRNVNIYIAKKSCTADSASVNAVQTLMNDNRIPGVAINVYAASESSVDLSISFVIKNGYVVNTVKNNISEAVNEYFSEMKVGQGLSLKKLGAKIISLDGVVDYSFGNAQDTAASASVLLKKGTITVTNSGVVS